MCWTLLVLVATVGPLMGAHPTTWAEGGDTEQLQHFLSTLQLADSVLPGTFPPNYLSSTTAQGKALLLDDGGKNKDIYVFHKSGDNLLQHVSADTKKSSREWRQEGQSPRIVGVDLQREKSWASQNGEDDESVGQETERTSRERKYAIRAGDKYTKEESNYVDRDKAFAGTKNVLGKDFLSAKGFPSSDMPSDRRGYQRLLNEEDTPEHAQYHHDNGDHGHHYDVEHGHDAEGHYLVYDRHGSGHNEHDGDRQRAKYHHNPSGAHNRRHDDGDDRRRNSSRDRKHHDRGYDSRSREHNDRRYDSRSREHKDRGHDSRSREHHDRGYNSRSREHHNNGYGHNHGQEYDHDGQEGHGHDGQDGHGHDDHHGYGHEDHREYGHDDQHGQEYGHDDQHGQEYDHGDHGQGSHRGGGHGSYHKRGHHNSHRNGDRHYYGHPYNDEHHYGHPHNHGHYSTLGSIWNEIRNYFRFS